jgi:hypothetical protein
VGQQRASNDNVVSVELDDRAAIMITTSAAALLVATLGLFVWLMKWAPRGRLIAGRNASLFRVGSYAGCRVVFAVGISRRMMGLRGRSLPVWTPHSAGAAVHPIRRNSSAHVPAGTYQRVRASDANRQSD